MHSDRGPGEQHQAGQRTHPCVQDREMLTGIVSARMGDQGLPLQRFASSSPGADADNVNNLWQWRQRACLSKAGSNMLQIQTGQGGMPGIVAAGLSGRDIAMRHELPLAHCLQYHRGP